MGNSSQGGKKKTHHKIPLQAPISVSIRVKPQQGPVEACLLSSGDAGIPGGESTHSTLTSCTTAEETSQPSSAARSAGTSLQATLDKPGPLPALVALKDSVLSPWTARSLLTFPGTAQRHPGVGNILGVSLGHW